MRIRVLSDLHTEAAPWRPPEVEADVVAVAGDVSDGGAESVGWIAAAFPRRPVLYVPGNHEAYDGVPLSRPGSERVARPAANLALLDRGLVLLGGVRFLGCTLWADFGLAGVPDETMARAGAALQDFRAVRDHDGRRFSPALALARHKADRDWLARKLAEPHDGPTVVITHHAPHRGSQHERYAGHPLGAAYASDLSGLIEASGPDLWIHGHVHDSVDYAVGRTRIVGNPRGRRRPDGSAENPDFDPCLVVEI